MTDEKNVNAISGYTVLLIVLLFLAVSVWQLVVSQVVWTITLLVLAFLSMPGFMIVNPNESKVLVLFGAYKGTVKKNGFWWVNPFMVKKNISLRARNLDSEPIKVNDKLGNPVMIGVVMVWKVEDTYKASFDVDDYKVFVDIQNEAAIRKLAGQYPYDNLEDENAQLTLRSSSEEVNQMLEKEITDRLFIAGIKVVEARINYLAYAQEIAGSMLKRQQASAIISARKKIVEGAVSMVEMALKELSEKEIIELDDERKANMVSNLMVVLTADKDVAPVLNTGTLY
ncbi:MAG: SPFH domain-containing protein [Bacteroidales bacterium]|nr:SPFH domain-containing protein [Bacteroidales bacterium]